MREGYEAKKGISEVFLAQLAKSSDGCPDDLRQRCGKWHTLPAITEHDKLAGWEARHGTGKVDGASRICEASGSAQMQTVTEIAFVSCGLQVPPFLSRPPSPVFPSFPPRTLSFDN